MKDVATIDIKPQVKMAIVADHAKQGSGSLSDNSLDRPNRRKSLKPKASAYPTRNRFIRDLKLSFTLRIRRGTENACAVDKLF
jgi:hypothetical protein